MEAWEAWQIWSFYAVQTAVFWGVLFGAQMMKPENHRDAKLTLGISAVLAWGLSGFLMVMQLA